MQKNTFFDDFISEIVKHSYKYEENNWDADRHGKREFIDLESLSTYLKYILNNRNEIENFISQLNDDESREIIKYIFLYRSLGYRHVKIPINKDLKLKINMEKSLSCITKESDLQTNFMVGGKLKSFTVPFMNKEIELDAWVGNIMYSFFVKQYYLKRNNFFVMPVYGDYVIDAGACFGDTALSFSVAVGKKGKVLSFEVVPDHIDVCTKNFDKNKDFSGNIKLYNYALSDRANTEINIELIGAGSREIKDGISNFNSIKVKTESIDNLVKEEKLEKIDFIKMDIEGAEMAALIGATETIRKFKPKLAISAYHKIVDFVEITNFIKSLEPSYKIFVEHYTIHSEETVIYATTENEYSYEKEYEKIIELYKNNNMDESLFYIRKMYSMFSDNINVNKLFYKILIKSKEFEEAVDILTFIIESGVYDKEVINDFIFCLREIGENELAESYKKSLE